MKKVLFSAAVVLLFAVSANAQRRFGKNDWFLSGKLSGLEFSHSFVDGASATSFELQAAGGYLFSNKFAVDGTLGFAYVDDVSGFTFGAGLRYYPAANLYARVGYQGLEVVDFGFLSLLQAEVGYDIFVSEKVFFEPAIHYQRQLSDGGANTIGLSLGIGVRF